jgi:hypothetical protein
VPQQNAAAAASPESAASFAEAHRRLLADSSMQFELAAYKQPVPPAWLRWLGDVLEAIFPVLKILFWFGVAALALYILYVVGRRLSGSQWPWAKKAPEEDPEESWRPAEAPARALLREADALAAAGSFSEAAHLLLFRSIEDIESRRPKLVRPAFTSRDIAGAPELPTEPRRAFSTIVMLVERSLFGGRRLGEQDWRECRTAYETFAFAGAWR